MFTNNEGVQGHVTHNTALSDLNETYLTSAADLGSGKQEHHDDELTVYAAGT